ncbi:MAG: type II toxin-antitoxin system RelE/ParE family toxin [Lentisphaeraceae bacterium]|nr:type II toxin-antitoxin system RelE/ParE family toxin [Lentisphaeraceae bacterium]
MTSYELKFHKNIKKDLRGIPKSDLSKILNKINELELNPFPDGHIKISGQDNLFRIRQGDYRILYTVENNELIVFVIKIKHRKEVYKNM